MSSRTVYRVLEETARRYGPLPALHQPSAENGRREMQTYTWSEYLRAAQEIAAGLRALGIGKGDIVALNSETRAEFYLADLGIMANGSIAAALYPNYPARDLRQTVETCRAAALFLEGPKMLGTFAAARVGRRILLTGAADGTITLADLRAMGRRAIAEDPGLIERLAASVSASDHAVLYLTSGATGEPKMALATHAAIVANIDMGPQALPLGPEDMTVAFLPSAHIAQRIVIEMLPIRSGMPVTFSESLMKLPQEIRAARPTILLAPPRMWERIYSTICTEIKKRPAAVQRLFYTALGLGLAAAERRRNGQPVPSWISAPLAVADRLLFRKLRGRFGGRLRISASGAAPLSKQLAEFYEAIGMPLVEGYGLTEGGVATLNPLNRPKPGSIGKALPGVEVRLAEDGELLLKSPCLFSEYFGDRQATAEVLRDGWLCTGDLGHIDSEGYIYITGRKKEVIVSSTGKKIYPARIEALFKTEPLISNVLLAGDRLPHLVALFTLNPAAAAALEGMEGFDLGSPALLASAPPVAAEVQKVVARVNSQLAPFEQIRRYKVLDREFTIDHGELTATMKVRRNRVLENFRQQIEDLYGVRGEAEPGQTAAVAKS